MKLQRLLPPMQKKYSACKAETLFLPSLKRRRVRVVEGARLESVYRGNSIKGSNPFVSATTF